MLIKPKGSPFYIFRHYATFSERKIISSFFFKKNVLRFLSLRYSADFRRSRLVHCLALWQYYERGQKTKEFEISRYDAKEVATYWNDMRK